MKCCLKVLEMIRSLHERGYQGLRIVPGMSPSGMHWRCSVTHRENITSDHGAREVDFDKDMAHYTSAAGDRYFDWNDAGGDTPSELADKFIRRFPEIAAQGKREDPAYALWFLEVIELAQNGTFPIAYDDWGEDLDPHYLPTIGQSKSRLPMPPGGSCA